MELSGSRRETESSTLPSLEIEFYLFLKSSSQSRKFLGWYSCVIYMLSLGEAKK